MLLLFRARPALSGEAGPVYGPTRTTIRNPRNRAAQRNPYAEE